MHDVGSGRKTIVSGYRRCRELTSTTPVTLLISLIKSTPSRSWKKPALSVEPSKYNPTNFPSSLFITDEPESPPSPKVSLRFATGTAQYASNRFLSRTRCRYMSMDAKHSLSEVCPSEISTIVDYLLSILSNISIGATWSFELYIYEFFSSLTVARQPTNRSIHSFEIGCTYLDAFQWQWKRRWKHRNGFERERARIGSWRCVWKNKWPIRQSTFRSMPLFALLSSSFWSWGDFGNMPSCEIHLKACQFRRPRFSAEASGEPSTNLLSVPVIRLEFSISTNRI